MTNDNCSVSAGQRLINAIDNGDLLKDCRPNHGKVFHGAYEELYLYKFKSYLGSVGRAVRNRQLTKGIYNGL
jgi:hypothetical protein